MKSQGPHSRRVDIQTNQSGTPQSTADGCESVSTWPFRGRNHCVPDSPAKGLRKVVAAPAGYRVLSGYPGKVLELIPNHPDHRYQYIGSAQGSGGGTEQSADSRHAGLCH